MDNKEIREAQDAAVNAIINLQNLQQKHKRKEAALQIILNALLDDSCKAEQHYIYAAVREGSTGEWPQIRTASSTAEETKRKANDLDKSLPLLILPIKRIGKFRMIEEK